MIQLEEDLPRVSLWWLWVFALRENGKEKQKYSQFSVLLWNNSQQSISQFFVALCNQFYYFIQKVYQRAFLDVQLLSLLWLITSHSHISTFFGLMMLISAFESSGVLIKGAMSSSRSVTTLRIFFTQCQNSSSTNTFTDDLFVFKDSFKPLILASNVSLETQSAISLKSAMLLLGRNAHVQMCLICAI